MQLESALLGQLALFYLNLTLGYMNILEVAAVK